MLGQRLHPSELTSRTNSAQTSCSFATARPCHRVRTAIQAENRPGVVLPSKLLQEIEERRRSQAELLKKLDILSKQVSEDVAVHTTSYVGSEEPPYLEPEPPMTEPVSESPPPPPPAPVVSTPQAPARAEPLAGPNVMNVVMVASECAPWSKTGGLGDVMGALPKALARRGHRVMVVSPRYQEYPDAWETGTRVRFSVFNSSQEVGYFHQFVDGVDFVFVDHPSFRLGKDIYSGDRMSQAFRNALLCKAALESVWHVPLGGVVYGDDNLVFMANDWHTALLPVYLQAHYRDYGKMQYARSLFVIHNMAYQGRAPFDEINHFELNDQYKEMFRLFDPMFKCEHMNIMKVGLQMAHRVVAVSGGYAWEVQTPDGGWGLHDIIKGASWKLKGIVNGIDYDEWDPATDPHLMSDGYAHYNVNSFVEGKRRCKLALQRELGLPENADIPLIGFVGRLDYQKGVDLIRDSYEWLMGQQVQLVMLGSGRGDLEDALRYMEDNCKSQCRGWVGFSVKTSHRITAAADILLMPSRFEPCGLNQLYAMRYGAVPVAHRTGGLKDTVIDFDPWAKKGTGWTYSSCDRQGLLHALGLALSTYRQHPEDFRSLQARGMERDSSWDVAAQQYEQIFSWAKFDQPWAK